MEQLLDEIEQKQGKKRKVSRRRLPKEPAFEAGSNSWSWEHLAILLAITLLGGVLRLYRLGDWSFWIDEVHTLRDAVLKTNDEFWNSGTKRYPLGFLMLRWLEPYLPTSSEGFYRLPYTFFGICSIPLLATVARRVIGSAPALLAALLLALSPWHLYWSQNVRFYTLVLFFSLAAMSAFYVGVETGRRRWLLTSLGLGALAALCHPSAALVIVAFVVYLIALRVLPVRWPEALDSKALMAFALPMIVGGLVLMTSVQEAFESFRAAKNRESLGHLINTSVWFLRVPILITGLGGAFLLWQRSRRLALFLMLMIVVPSCGVAVGSLFAQASAQYLFFTLPVWCLLSAYGAWEIVRRAELTTSRAFAIRAVVFGVLLLDPVAQDHLYFHYRHGDRPYWRNAASYVQDNANPEDFIASTNEPSLEWYVNPANPLRALQTADGEQRKTVELIASWTMQKLPEWKKRADEKNLRMWLIGTPPTLREADVEKRWYRWLRENCKQALSLPNWLGPRDMSVQVWRYDPVDPKTKLPRTAAERSRKL